MASPKIVKLLDGSFKGDFSFGLAGDNRLQKPELLEWDRSMPSEKDVAVFTDAFLQEHSRFLARKRIALLIESPAIRPGIYQWIEKHFHEFDVVLTHQQHLVDFGYPFLFYPSGGSQIEDWGVFPKTKMISLLFSFKTGTEGHRLRHRVAELPGIDCHGSGVGAHVRPFVALRDYRFTIVIENIRADAYFAKKIVDAISQGCVPIYWGCPSIQRFFNPAGIICWENLEELAGIIASLQPEDYIHYAPYLPENLERAREFRCPEDWIMRVYPRIFDD